MQSISVYLYPNRVEVFTNTLATWQTERYRRVYNRNLKIHKGVSNRIDLQVKNSDQKLQDITGSSVVFNLINSQTEELILQKDCSVQSASGGKIYATLTATELMNFDPGYYHYSLTLESRTDIDGDTYAVTSRTPLYIDSQYGGRAVVEILPSLLGEPVDSTTVTTFSYHDPAVTGYSEPTKYYYSSIINANPTTSDSFSNHTFQINMTDYIGDLLVEGSFYNNGNPTVWVDVTSTIPVNGNNIIYTNVTGKYNWFRIKHIPATNNTGTVDKILYR